METVRFGGNVISVQTLPSCLLFERQNIWLYSLLRCAFSGNSIAVLKAHFQKISVCECCG